MPGQALDEPTLASHALPRPLSSLGPAISTSPSIHGTKRNASNMENVETSCRAPQTYPPIKLEPDSPNRSDYRGSTKTDTRPELCGVLVGYASSSSSDDMEDQMFDIHENEGTTTMKPSRTPQAAGIRLNMSSRDIFAPLEKEVEIQRAGATLQNNSGGTNGLLRPLSMLDNFTPPHQQKASRRPENPRSSNGNKFEDVGYNSIPDYTPPISTLPRGNPHILQVHWKGKSVVDLSNDPDRYMLHEAEINLATSLNLSCAKYLCTKRRIFQARFEALLAGREFKRSDSQKACRINSNKAGKLCGAWEKVGWFEKKYFLKYLEESNNPLRKANNENKDSRSLSSGLTEPDIWDVSESEFHLTSEGDEESTDDDTADSSVSFNGRHDETEGRTNLDSYRNNSLSKQHHGLSLIGGNGSQRRVLIDRTVQSHDALSGDESVDEGPMIEGKRPREGAVLKDTVDPQTPDGLSGNDIAGVPVLETRSMTKKIKLALNSQSGDKSDTSPIIEAKSSHRKSGLENIHQRAAPSNRLGPRNPIPHSLDEANAADIMLLKMREKGRPWLEIEEAWEKKTGKAQTTKSLSCRYIRIKANLANTRLEPVKVRDSHRALTHPLLEPDDVRDKATIIYPTPSSLKQDQLLLAAEAEIEGNFQREKTELIAEIENNFQSEKWGLVAEAMSRRGLAHYSAESIQAQYERLARDTQSADAKEKENLDTTSDLPQRTTQTVKGRKTETSTPSRFNVGRHDEASNLTSLLQPQHPRLLLHQKRPKSKIEAATALRGKAIRKNKFAEEQSARALRAWAKRRALGTNGRYGGPPKASTIANKAKMAVPNAGIPLAPTVTYQSGQSPESLPNQTAPTVIAQEVRHGAHQHKQPFAQNIPAAPQTDSAQAPIKPSRKRGVKRHTCRKCGMSYADRSNHYRVFPNIGSEHRRGMAAKHAAAEGHLGPATTDVGVESTSDILNGQMIFEISSRDESPELLSLDDRELLGEGNE